MTTRHYCTYFDLRYLPRAIALYRSLKRVSSDFQLWALCFDATSYQQLCELNLPEIHPISLDEFLLGDNPLQVARNNRSTVEFYFTCSPSLPLFVFRKAPDVHQLTYLDADLYFYRSPEPLFDEIGTCSIAIIPHRFPPILRSLVKTGIFNVGWLTFRNDEEGLQCLSTWRNQCLEWCFDRIEEGRYGDQGYLSDWPQNYHDLRIIEHLGANLAPWNVGNGNLKVQNDKVWVGNNPLIFFHFQSLARISKGIYKLNFRKYRTIPSTLIKKKIYLPYLLELERIVDDLKPVLNDDRVRAPNDLISLFAPHHSLGPVTFAKYLLKTFRDLILRDYIFLNSKNKNS